MNAIVCIDADYNIGYKQSLLYNFKEDKKFFRETTKNNVVIMGRKTYESIGKPLKGRVNIVLSKSEGLLNDIEIDDTSTSLIVVNSLVEILQLAKEYEKIGKKVFIIGGESIYSLFVKFCDTLYITRVNTISEKADTKFPPIPWNDYSIDVLGVGESTPFNNEDRSYSYSILKITKKDI